MERPLLPAPSHLRKAMLIGCIPWLILQFLFANLAKGQVQTRIFASETAALGGPPISPEMQAAVSLNHRALAADLTWIQAQIYYGEHYNAHLAMPHLKAYADTIVALDPHFYPVYSWFAATYIASNYPVSFSTLETVSDFQDKGLAAFPTDPELPFQAAMNYIGYSADRSAEERLAEIDRALEYLNRASALPEASESIPFVASWFYNRKRQLLGDNTSPDGAADEIALYTHVYLMTEDDALRERIEQAIRAKGLEHEFAEQAERLAVELTARRRAELPFLPADLWTQTARGASTLR